MAALTIPGLQGEETLIHTFTSTKFPLQHKFHLRVTPDDTFN